LAVTVSVLGLIAAIAAPNVTKMVQDSRIKSTTNHILGSLQFARQTAAIEQKQVTACSPAPGNPESCALSKNWQSGLALLLGKARINSYTPPAPPASPTPTAAPSAPSRPDYPPEPAKQGYPSKPDYTQPAAKPAYPPPPEAPEYLPTSNPPLFLYRDDPYYFSIHDYEFIANYESIMASLSWDGKVIDYNKRKASQILHNGELYGEIQFTSPSSPPSFPQSSWGYVLQNCSDTGDYINYEIGVSGSPSTPGEHDYHHPRHGYVPEIKNYAALSRDKDGVYHNRMDGGAIRHGYGNDAYYVKKTNISSKLIFCKFKNKYNGREYILPYLTVSDELMEWVNETKDLVKRANIEYHDDRLYMHREYEKKYHNAIRQYGSLQGVYDENSRRRSDYHSELGAHADEKKKIDAQYQELLQAHAAAYQKQLADWELEKASIDSANQQAMSDWQQQKANIDDAHQQQLALHQQQVDAHQRAWQKQLDDHAKAMQAYNEELAKTPEKVVVLEEAKTLLAHNPFSVTVTSELHGKTSGIVYDKDRVKGHGRIHIEDKRGRGEHSRTVCINMLGNIQVVKGNETCP